MYSGYSTQSIRRPNNLIILPHSSVEVANLIWSRNIAHILVQHTRSIQSTATDAKYDFFLCRVKGNCSKTYKSVFPIDVVRHYHRGVVQMLSTLCRAILIMSSIFWWPIIFSFRTWLTYFNVTINVFQQTLILLWICSHHYYIDWLLPLAI